MVLEPLSGLRSKNFGESPRRYFVYESQKNRQKKMALSKGAVAGIVIAVLIVLIVAIAVPLALRPKKPTTNRCTVNSDCTVPGQICLDNFTCGPPPPPPGCSAQNPCVDPTKICQNGVCVPNPVQTCAWVPGLNTIVQSDYVVTGLQTNFTSDMVGMNLRYTSGPLIGTAQFITEVSSTTSLTTDTKLNSSLPSQYELSKPCASGLQCINGQCFPIPPGVCVTASDCKDPTKPYCCTSPTGTKSCQACCNDSNCNPATGSYCNNGTCQQSQSKTCSESNPCTGAGQKCCPDTSICSLCCTNPDCTFPAVCQVQPDGSRACVTPTPPPVTFRGLSVPSLTLGGGAWQIASTTANGSSLLFQTVGFTGTGARLSFAFQGNGNVTSGCNPYPSYSIGQWDFQGGFGPPNSGETQLRRCPLSSQPECGLDQQCATKSGATPYCVIGTCADTKPLDVPWIVIGGLRVNGAAPTSSSWTFLPIDPSRFPDPVNKPYLYIVSPTGSLFQFSNLGNIVNTCATGSAASNLISSPGYSKCSDVACGKPGTGLDANNNITAICAGQGTYSLPPGGLVLPWLQIGSWTIYSNVDQLFFEDSANLKTLYAFDLLGNVTGYCRGSSLSTKQKGTKINLNKIGNPFSKLLQSSNVFQNTDLFKDIETSNPFSYGKNALPRPNMQGTDTSIVFSNTNVESGFFGNTPGSQPNLINQCLSAPPLPTNACINNSQCTVAGQICIGGSCRVEPY